MPKRTAEITRAGFRPAFLESAQQAGAAAYVSEKVYDSPLPCLLVSDIRRAMAVLANAWDEDAWKAFSLVGITGTKGKSTTACYLRAIADRWYASQDKKPIGFLSTIDTYDGVESFESHLTTPEALELAKRFMHAREAGLEAMVMEVSSQALKYDRTYGVQFKIGCFMNFGSDHIGETEHPTLEDYFQSKLKFFEQTENCVLNLDTERLPEIKAAALASKSIKRIVTFSASGAEGADFKAEGVRKEGGATCFSIMRKAAAGDAQRLRDATGEPTAKGKVIFSHFSHSSFTHGQGRVQPSMCFDPRKPSIACVGDGVPWKHSMRVSFFMRGMRKWFSGHGHVQLRLNDLTKLSGQKLTLSKPTACVMYSCSVPYTSGSIATSASPLNVS